MLGLCCCARAFSSCREQELFSSCGAWASHCGASLVAEQGLCGARDLVVAKQGLTHPEACGSWTKQGLGPSKGLPTPRRVGSSWTRDQTGIPCTARRTLNHWTTRETQMLFLFSVMFYFLLAYICFTILCEFLLYNKVNQLYIYIYIYIYIYTHTYTCMLSRFSHIQL